MELTPEEIESKTTALVAVRVPRNSDVDLASDAERRIARADSIADVTLDELHGVEPRLSATIVTVAVTVKTTDNTGIIDRLADAHGIESVDRLKR